MITEFYTKRGRYSLQSTPTYCGVLVEVYLQADGTYIGKYGSLPSGNYWISPVVGECDRTFPDYYSAHEELAARWEQREIQKQKLERAIA